MMLLRTSRVLQHNSTDTLLFLPDTVHSSEDSQQLFILLVMSDKEVLLSMGFDPQRVECTVLYPLDRPDPLLLTDVSAVTQGP